MILSRLYLENYKQFREATELLPPEGAIGIVGPNGSGKTTVFEAILWAFFGSRGGGPRFANDAIPFSGGSTADKTLVQVTVDVAGTSHTVSRSLQSNKTTARVHDDAGIEVTSGPSEVAAWVQENILGMDRTAFEATFFARQKELEFFAGVTGVQRQREVARILRIDQVEDAQKLLRNDRNDLKREAAWIEQQLAEADHDSLVTDLRELREEYGSLETKTKTLRSEFEKRGEELEKARAETERLEKLYREHNRLSGEHGRATSARDRANERASELEERLRGLDEDAKKISELEPETKGLEEVSREMAVLEEARRREERRSAAKQELHRHHRDAYESSREASEMVDSLARSGRGLLPEWPETSENEDESEVDVARRVSDILKGADAAHLRSEEEARKLCEIREKHETLESKNTRLENGEAEIGKARERLKDLDAEIEEVSGGESLDERISTLRERRESLQSEAAKRSGRADSEEREAAKMEKARRMVEDSDEHAKCPTCRRGFEKDEHAEVIESLRELEESSRERAEEHRREHRRLESEAKEVQKQIGVSENARAKLYEKREKRSAEKTRLENMQKVFEEIQGEIGELRKGLSGAPKPSPEEISSSRDRTDRLRSLRDARPALVGLVSQYDRASEAAEEKRREVENLSSGPAYDQSRHAQLSERQSEIQSIRGEIKNLRSRLEARPSIERDLKKTRADREEAAKETARLESELKKLGFDEERYAGARRDSSEAERLREEARERRDESERELRGLQNAVEGLKKELARHEEQRKLADKKSVEAASLDDMDSLFSEFYRELTARVRPNLQREASELMKTLSEGRYDRMEFDENYGVKLYDGFSDAYEISRFSGGESDIASLCARVALSKMISGKGAGALGFIVLDEVFGALDSSRRRNVLLALDRLKQTFGQIFIISHVADVQESPLLDETWIIEEDERNTSRVHATKPGSPLEAIDLSGRSPA